MMCCITNLRMLCNSTFLYDKQTQVSPKRDELSELLGELLAAGPHKAVIFSQWEVMLQQVAEMLDALKIEYVLLSGNVPSKDRRELMDRFRDDADCRIFLSTDAGGTGLNLQAADTVINLEVPWNPAVLEQRIARVHRLGQHRPVQVFNFVTRGTIEERVLKTLELKKSLFDGVFEGVSDEVDFAALGRQTFLDTVRQLVVEEEPRPHPIAEPVSDLQGQEIVEKGVQFLEALAMLFGATQTVPQNGHSVKGVESLVTIDAKTGKAVLQVPLPSADTLQRGAAALQIIVQGLAATSAK
jgi:hypothetical protein